MKLTRHIPARTETLNVLWCRRDFLTMSQSYRAVRERMANPMDTCYLCHHKLADGETISIACIEGKGNKVLCVSCADKVLASEPLSA